MLDNGVQVRIVLLDFISERVKVACNEVWFLDRLEWKVRDRGSFAQIQDQRMANTYHFLTSFVVREVVKQPICSTIGADANFTLAS